MRQSSIYTSIGFHVFLAVATMVSLPWLKKDFVIPPPIAIELVEMDKITQTDKFVEKPAPKQEDKKEAPTPPAAAKNDASDAVKPTPKKPDEPKKEDKKKETVEKEGIPDKKKPPEKKKEEKKAEEKPRDFSSVLKNLAEPKKTAPPSDTPDLKATDTAAPKGQNAPLGAKMTMSEEDALRRQLEKCWNVPFGAKDAQNTVFEIFMVINPDRTLQSAKVVDQSRYNSDTFFRAMADSAMRAVRNPLCSPFMLPPDKYDVWKQTTVTFNPSQMF